MDTHVVPPLTTNKRQEPEQRDDEEERGVAFLRLPGKKKRNDVMDESVLNASIDNKGGGNLQNDDTQEFCRSEALAARFSLPDDILRAIMEFVGPGQFRFIGGACQRWRQVYKKQFDCTTCMEEVTESIPRCRLYLEEAFGDAKYTRLVTTDADACAQLCKFAAFYGRLEVLEWATRNSLTSSSDTSTCAYAARSGRLDILKWVREKDFPWDWSTCANAAKYGHLEILKWARANGCDWDSKTCLGAYESGDLEIINWVWDHGCPLPLMLEMLRTVAANGHLHVLQAIWDDVGFDDINEYWHPSICACAAENGQLEVLQRLHRHGCSWDVWTCSNATKNGHSDVFQWARQNGCPCDTSSCASLAKIGY